MIMCIVTLEDGTQYYINTDNKYDAREVVEYKLRQRLDFRKIESIVLLEGCYIDKFSKNYNSGDQYDGKDLQASHGWAYKY